MIDRLRALERSPLIEAAISRTEELAKTPPWAGERVWVHGDLYGRHLLCGADGALTGIIDWGDMHAGDRALDLSIAWSFLPRQAHADFLARYGPVDRDTWARARFRSLHYGPFLILYGQDVEDPAIEEVGRLAIEQAI